MKRLLSIIFVILLPMFAWAQTATPTVTNTPFRSDSGDGAIKALYKHMTTVLPTAVPTAYITPAHVTNPLKLKLGRISVVNKSNCDVVLSFDGENDDEIVPASSALDENLSRDKRYHNGGIFIRGQAACTTGNVYISSRY